MAARPHVRGCSFSGCARCKRYHTLRDLPMRVVVSIPTDLLASFRRWRKRGSAMMMRMEAQSVFSSITCGRRNWKHLH